MVRCRLPSPQKWYFKAGWPELPFNLRHPQWMLLSDKGWSTRFAGLSLTWELRLVRFCFSVDDPSVA
jgi:hypothetical protein